MLRTILAALAALLIVNLMPAPLQAATLHFNFQQFPAPIFVGQPAPLRWDEEVFAAEWLFRYDDVKGETTEALAARVYAREAEKPEKRFAGRYVVLTTGCGTAFQCGAIVDLQNGRPAAALPPATTGYDYRPGSRLLIVNGEVPPQADYHQYWENTTYYYLWNGREFDLIAEDPWPGSESAAADPAWSDTAATASANP